MIDKNTILTFQILSTIFIIVLGTILHYTFNWSNKNPLVGTFSAVNESTWEHLKLLFFPMLITIIVGYFYIGKDIPNFICAKTVGIVVAMFSIYFLSILSYFDVLFPKVTDDIFEIYPFGLLFSLTKINVFLLSSDTSIILSLIFKFLQMFSKQFFYLKTFYP